MKNIIKAYRKDQEKWGKLVEYAKHLEAEVIRLKEILIANGYTDNRIIGDSKPAKVISELRQKINEQEQKMKDLKKNLKDKEIKKLKRLIEEEYPLRKHKISEFKRIVKSQNEYIEELQNLLEKNEIPYWPKEPVNDLERVGLDIVDENAVRLEADLNP